MQVKVYQQDQPLLTALGSLPTGAIVQLNAPMLSSWQGASKLVRLQRLSLSHSCLGTQCVDELEHLAQLTHLSVSAPYAMFGWEDLTADELAILQRLTQLQDLAIPCVAQGTLLAALPAVAVMPLRTLNVHSCTEAGLAALLPAVQALTYLRCHLGESHEPDPTWQQQLQSLSRLEELLFHSGWLATIPAGLPTLLTSLRISQQSAAVSQLQRLGGLRQLRRLTICGCDSVGGHMQAALEELPPLSLLAELDLSILRLEVLPATLAVQTTITRLVLNFNRCAPCLPACTDL